VNSQEIQDSVYTWAQTQNFSAPYGVLTGQHVNAKGRKYLSVTFGRARTLDATVEIYNRNFIILRTSRNGSEVYNDVATLMARLGSL
jgi:hypothetical protein